MLHADVDRLEASAWAAIAHMLTAQQARVLHLRFGQSLRPVSRMQVAAMLGVSLWAERQIENDALRRLRWRSLSSSRGRMDCGRLPPLYARRMPMTASHPWRQRMHRRKEPMPKTISADGGVHRRHVAKPVASRAGWLFSAFERGVHRQIRPLFVSRWEVHSLSRRIGRLERHLRSSNFPESGSSTMGSEGARRVPGKRVLNSLTFAELFWDEV